MELKDLTVEVRSANLKRVGIVDMTDAAMTVQAVFNNVGSWELTLPLEHPMVGPLRTPGSGIKVTGPGGTFLSGPTTYFGSAASKEAPEGMVTFQGLTDEHHLADRLAYPVPTSSTMAGQTKAANDIRTGAVETVMHGFVNANIGPAAPAKRRIPNLLMAPDLGRGPSIRKTTRFAVLGNVLKEVAVLGGLGFRIVQVGNALQFQTFDMKDKRKSIRMDLWNNTLASYQVEQAAPVVTHVIVAGQEQGTKRQLVERTSEESLQQEALWHRRIETFLDQRQTEDLEELRQAGDELLQKDGIAQFGVKFVPMDETTMRFLYDFNLGDVVTAVVEGREISAVVSEAIVKIDNDGVRVACALGDQSSTGDAINSVEQRLSNLERNMEVQEGLATQAWVTEQFGGGAGGGSATIGTVTAWAGAKIPAGWLQCDGQAVSRSEFGALFSIVGTAFGAGDGSTTFNLPNLSGRVPVGLSGTADFSTLGQLGGAKTHVLTEAEMPSHTHVQNAHNHTQNPHAHLTGISTSQAFGAGPAGTVTAQVSHAPVVSYTANETATNNATTAVNQATGGGAAHNNLQPYTVVHYIIRASATANPGDAVALAELSFVKAENARLEALVQDRAGDSGWIDCALNTAKGWTVYSATGTGTTAGPQVRRIGNRVFMVGFVRRTGTGLTGDELICTVPAGFRPPRQVHLPASALNLFASVGVNATGFVVWKGGDPSNWLSLDGLSWFIN